MYFEHVTRRFLFFYFRGRERQERERESDWKKHRKSRSPDRKNDTEKSGAQSSLSREEPPPKKKKEEVDPILTRTGGAYIPPAKLRMMQAQITDKNRYTIFFLKKYILYELN